MRHPEIIEHSKDKVWATRITSRNPQFKMHSGLGPARNAIMYSGFGKVRGGGLYAHTPEHWELIASVPGGISVEDARDIIDRALERYNVD